MIWNHITFMTENIRVSHTVCACVWVNERRTRKVNKFSSSHSLLLIHSAHKTHKQTSWEKKMRKHNWIRNTNALFISFHWNLQQTMTRKKKLWTKRRRRRQKYGSSKWAKHMQNGVNDDLRHEKFTKWNERRRRSLPLFVLNTSSSPHPSEETRQSCSAEQYSYRGSRGRGRI